MKEAELLELLARVSTIEAHVKRLLNWERLIVGLLVANSGAHAAGLL